MLKRLYLEQNGCNPVVVAAAGGAAVAEKSSMESGMMKNDEGLDFVRLVSPSGASAEVYLYGGVVTSYKDAEGTEFIAVRPDAKMDGSKPISGGLSHCWPQVRLLFDMSCCMFPVFTNNSIFDAHSLFCLH